MCRLYAFHANEQTKVECTLVHAQNSLLVQSQGDAMGRLHSDGWGIAYFADRKPIVEKSFAAAYEGLHFSSTAERVFARTVVAHVRLATVGTSSIDNCHPFRWGNWIFAHNGTVRGIDTLRDRLLAEMGIDLASRLRGSTDSEILFHWLVGRLLRKGLIDTEECHDLQFLSQCIAESIAEIDRRCANAAPRHPAKLNVVLTNGCVLVASRLRNSLYWVDRAGLHDCEICGIPHVRHDNSISYHAVVIASEPLSSENWSAVPDHSVVAVAEDLSTIISPISA